MWSRSLEVLRCRACSGSYELHATETAGDEILAGELSCTGCKQRVPIEDAIPRFVPRQNYASSFGFQWKRFGELQVDRLHSHTMSRDRFFLEVGIPREELASMRVLEAGCGGGRFSDVVLEAGAELYSVDLSDAVDKNRDIHQSHERLHLLQASITDLPLRPGSFDLVFCFGVIQHTPDPAATFRALVPFVKPGGRLAVDVYAAHPKQVLHWKYLLRPLAKRMPKDQLLDVIERATPPLLEVARTLRRVPKIGKALTRLVPLKIHEGILNQFPLDIERKLAVLETFDAYSPAYDRPRSRRTVERWFRDAGFSQIETFSLMRGLNYGRAIKPR